MSKRLLRQKLIIHIIVKVFKTLELNRTLKSLHLPSEEKLFHSHPETILAVANIIAKSDYVWEMLELNPKFSKEDKKKKLRKKLRKLLR